MRHKCTSTYEKVKQSTLLFLNTLPFPLMCYFPDFTAFGLRETFEYHLAQWSSPEIISNNAYLDHFVTLKEQQFKSYNLF